VFLLVPAHPGSPGQKGHKTEESVTTGRISIDFAKLFLILPQVVNGTFIWHFILSMACLLNRADMARVNEGSHSFLARKNAFKMTICVSTGM